MVCMESTDRLLDAAMNVIRAKGYGATRVDDIATAADLTKGSFFHHFATKEDCAREAAQRWTKLGEVVFAASGFRQAPTASARIVGYLDCRVALLDGPVASYTCYAGTVLQEVHQTHPELAAECAASMLEQIDSLVPDLATALGEDADEAPDLAIHILAVIQGALIVAKAEGGNRGARASLQQLKRYLQLRFKEDTNG